MEDLVHRQVYRLLARNIKIGVWDAEHQEFLGIRTKFGKRFVTGENHWDAPEFATACPMEAIGDLPVEISIDFGNRKMLFSFLEAKEHELGILKDD